MGTQTEIKAVITAEDRASAALKSFGDGVGSMGDKVLGAAKVAGEAMLAAGAAAVGFGALSVKAFMETQDVQAQLNSVLNSTHHAAGLYIHDLNDQAAALQKVTKFSDEQVGSAQALLLTFTNISGAVFQQATPAILDLATAMHEDLQSASVQVGKALNDPVLGITALHRIGVTFSETQKQQIKGFVDTNNLAAAQGVILKELNKEFGGSAEAAGKTFGGQLAILKNKLNDIQETIGSLILKYLTPFVSKIADFVSKVDWQKVIDQTVAALKRFGEWLKNTYESIKQVADQVVQYLEPKLIALWHTIDTQIIPVLMKLWKEVIQPLLPIIGTALVVAVGAVIDALNLLLKIITPVINFMLDHKQVVIDLALTFGILALAMNFGAIISAFNLVMDSAILKMETMRLVTLPNLATSLSTFGAFGIFAAAAVVALDAVYQKGQQTLSLLQQLNNQEATDNASQSSAMKEVIDAYHSGKISKEQYQKFFSNLAGRAMGGSVTAGQPFIVGEQGQELFIPSQNGTIIPNNKLSSFNASSQNISITVQAGAFMGSQIDARRYAAQIMDAMNDLASKKNTTPIKMMGG